MKLALFFKYYDLETGRFVMSQSLASPNKENRDMIRNHQIKNYTRKSYLKYKSKQNVPCFEQLIGTLKR